MLSNIFTLGFLVSLLASTIRLATPILVPALGQIFTQKAGILNLGVEGTMTIGAVSGFSVAYLTGNLWIGILGGIIFGMLWSLLMACLSITMKANQVIAGIGLNILGAGVAVYAYRVIFGIQKLPPQVETFSIINIPLLSDIPIIGPIFFQHNILVYLGFLLVPITWFVLEKTTFGLKIKAVGEHPRAADSKGISVAKIRYSAVLIGGAYAGAAGAFMTIAYLNQFTEAIIGGRGYIAISVVIFSRFIPKRSMLGALLFGFASALQMRLQALGINIANQLLLMLPYIMTVLALILASKKSEIPSAYTIPYSRLER
ncbi:ABC transporter permease [Anaerocolumna aminovalerica]|uniref:Nucleoside ABC transporter membrane protein n=1 Tax=Anaerocolumna aminovalerica TaxID=1527 RepID=A0A1I5EMI7_9FIRM|nr:ABC transporter permease [Anaerocolumna aminovalerica]MBU5331907.1 ABC transporter permease [Anaerocolumna aminovalerica]MDU6264168.1 ABC transporter permease [Anaerocolumna aminovalerica]SFO12725.1 nucleoside ABC transporter membrane protein [Anaerocolumna aminovalerica]